MNPIIHTFAFISAISFSACANSANHDKPESLDSVLNPVEQNSANTTYKPAFEGQTRVPGTKTKTSYTVNVLTSKLDRPWGIAVLNPEKFILTEKSGNIRIVDKNGNISAALTAVPKVANDGQGGLLDITLDPDFSSNRMVYWTFTHALEDGKNLTAVAKGRLSDDEKGFENVKIIYQAGPAHKGNLHYGGRLIFDKTGYLLVSTGERSDKETRPLAQDLKTGLGKILRMDKDGKAPSNNPYINNPDALPELYTYGHRNVQGLAIHPVTGDLWETEFGPRGGDELNLIQAGKNYGWPTITYGIEYGGAAIGNPPIQQQEGLEQPIYYWDPVMSPSGMAFYSKKDIPEWENNLFIAGLSSTHIARLVIKDHKVIAEERLLTKEGERFRAVIDGQDGALYAITDAGKLYKIGK